MKTFIFIITIFITGNVFGQGSNKEIMYSPFQVDKDFKDTFSFDKKWNYPWYIVVDDYGHMENTLGGTLEKDTMRLYHSANCMTNHQGPHRVNYCKAVLTHDTIQLFFLPEYPAYASKLNVFIMDNVFSTDFYASYPSPKLQLSWYISKQSLVLDKSTYVVGDTIRGYLEVEFVETNVEKDQIQYSEKYYYKGYFKTRLYRKE